MSNKTLKLNVDLVALQKELEDDLASQLKEKIQTLSKQVVKEDYNLGNSIKAYLQSWISANLNDVVKKEIESADFKGKVDKALDVAVAELVRKEIKNLKVE